MGLGEAESSEDRDALKNENTQTYKLKVGISAGRERARWMSLSLLAVSSLFHNLFLFFVPPSFPNFFFSR